MNKLIEKNSLGRIMRAELAKLYWELRVPGGTRRDTVKVLIHALIDIADRELDESRYDDYAIYNSVIARLNHYYRSL